jgi:hypothetical protein
MEQELSRANSVKIEKAINPSKRQTVLSGRKGRAYADFIEPGTGLSAVAKATTTDPIIFTSAAGFDRTGPIDYINKITTDQTFTGLTANATNFLGFERIDQYTVNKITTTTPPLYDSVFGSDNENKACATFDGTLAATTFNDFYGNTIRMYNGTAIAAGHPSGSGNSMRFGGTDDFAELDLAANKINLNTLDSWTIEFWFKMDTVNTGTNQFLLSAQSIYFLQLYKAASDATTIGLQIGDGSAYNAVDTTFTVGTLSNATWYHIAIVFEGRNIKLYRDGALRYSSGILGADYQIGNISKLFFGKSYPDILWLTGNISNFAIWPYAKYTLNSNTYTTSAFTPNTANMTADTAQEDRYLRVKNRFHIDLSNATANTTAFRESYGNNLIFKNNGSGTNQPFIESVTGPGSFGTVKTLRTMLTQYAHVEISNIIFPKKWTFETYFYRVTNPNNSAVFIMFDESGAAASFSFYINASNVLLVYASSDASTSNIMNAVSTGITISNATWYHVAVSYDGLAYRIFVNGALTNTTSSLLKVFQFRNVQIGGQAGSDQSFNGNFFMPIFSPYAKYTSAFSVPTSFPAPESIYYYDITKAKMYSGYKGNWTENNTVFLGEVETNATTVNRAITYSLNGEIFIDGIDGYGSGVTNAGATTIYKLTMAHNIGTDRIKIDDWFEWKKSYSFKLVGEKNKLMEYYAPYGATVMNPLQINDRNYFSFHIGQSGFLFDYNGAATGADVVSSTGYGKLQFKVERNF